MESWREKNYILGNCMWLTSKRFNWTSHYRNPDGPCSVQASGDCNMLPCLRCIIPFLFPGVQRTFNQDTTGWWNLYFTVSLGNAGRFQGILEGFGTIIPPFLWNGFLKSLFFTLWDDARELVLSGSRADLSDLQLERISSINTPHLHLAPDLQQLRI